jgi:hypothetical protein
VVAGLLIAATELTDSKIYPLPPGVNPEDPTSLKAAMVDLPTGALLLVLLGWTVGTFARAWVTARRVDWAPIAHGLVLGARFASWASS